MLFWLYSLLCCCCLVPRSAKLQPDRASSRPVDEELYDMILAEDSEQAAPSVSSLVSVELQQFWDLPDEPRDCDPLTWWQQKVSRHPDDFPVVSQLARKYLTPLPTTAIAECSFSKAKFWCRAERSCLSHERLDMLTTLDSLFSGMSIDDCLEAITSGEIPSPGSRISRPEAREAADEEWSDVDSDMDDNSAAEQSEDDIVFDASESSDGSDCSSD